ncbi:hypothetical protein [Megamonas funiformis]|uniref:hypothetical protein n=1 Tax=Megamonas funiformis TaxID=437897 RepID=UPI003AF8858F
MFKYFTNKKNFLVVTVMLFIFIFGSINIAIANTNERWFWLTSNDKFSLYVDKESVKYNKNTDEADVFVKYVYPSEKKVIMLELNINYKRHTERCKEAYLFTEEMNFIKSLEDYPRDECTIVPETIMETLAISISKLLPR